MRFLMVALSLAGFLSAAEIPQGTHVLLRMVNAVSTRTAREGDRIYIRMASPIVVNGRFVLPATGSSIFWSSKTQNVTEHPTICASCSLGGTRAPISTIPSRYIRSMI